MKRISGLFLYLESGSLLFSSAYAATQRKPLPLPDVLVEDRSTTDDENEEKEEPLSSQEVSGLASSCSGGVQLYLREPDFGNARFQLFKDGHPVSYWHDDGLNDWQLFSVACFPQVVLLWGEGGNGIRTYALFSHKGKPTLINLTVSGAGIESIEADDRKTAVRLYKSKWGDEGTVEYIFDTPFTIAEHDIHPKEKHDRWPHIRRSDSITDQSKGTYFPLAMKATCYHDGIEIRAEAWRTGEGAARLRIPVNDSEHTLSFLPTSGLCWEGKMILHGQKDGQPAAAVIESRKDERKSGEEHIITTISEVDPATVPFVPYAGEVR